MVASPGETERPLKPIFVIHGPDAYLRREALTEVTRRVLGDVEDHLAFADYEGDSAGLADVLDDVRTPPFLAPVRLVIVRDADGFVSKHRRSLETYVESPSSVGVLVLLCRSFPGNTKLAKMVARVGTTYECKPPRGAGMDRWLIHQAQSHHDKRLEGHAAGLLRRLVGDELGLLDAEVAKLAIYVGSRTAITTDDVQALVGHHREEKVFGIIDAVARGDTGAAIHLWEQVWATDRAAQGRAIAGLAWGVRQLLVARLDVDGGAPIGKAAARLHRDPSQARRQLDRFSSSELEDQLVKLLAVDVRAKTGAGTVQSAVQQFIIQWCMDGAGN